MIKDIILLLLVILILICVIVCFYKIERFQSRKIHLLSKILCIGKWDANKNMCVTSNKDTGSDSGSDSSSDSSSEKTTTAGAAADAGADADADADAGTDGGPPVPSFTPDNSSINSGNQSSNYIDCYNINTKQDCDDKDGCKSIINDLPYCEDTLNCNFNKNECNNDNTDGYCEWKEDKWGGWCENICSSEDNNKDKVTCEKSGKCIYNDNFCQDKRMCYSHGATTCENTNGCKWNDEWDGCEEKEEMQCWGKKGDACNNLENCKWKDWLCEPTN